MRPRSSAVSAVFFPPFPFHPFFSSSSSQNGNRARARARARADALQQCWMEKAVQLQFHKMFTNQISDLVEALMHAKFVNHDLSHVRITTYVARSSGLTKHGMEIFQPGHGKNVKQHCAIECARLLWG